MRKISFKNDYSDGGHPSILAALPQLNLNANDGYGLDEFSASAVQKIQRLCGNSALAVHFVCGGTQANLLTIAAVLRPYESVISAESGHIFVHETGAIEATGHKIQAVKCTDGKLTPEAIQSALNQYENEHTVLPRMVYLSNTTELGTVYSHAELRAISDFCKSKELFLYLDGARLGAALTAEGSDLSLEVIASCCDAFSIGGTKNGALLGEALVIKSKDTIPYFRHHMKQRGALLAKGALLGIQFHTLFTEDLFFKLAAHANQMATELAQGILQAGYELKAPQASNQLFPIFPIAVIKRLEEFFEFYTWEQLDEGNAVVRLVCSWATSKESVQNFLEVLTK